MRTSLFFDAEAVRNAIRNSPSQKVSLERLGQSPVIDNYRRLQEACVRYSLPVPGRAKKQRKNEAKPQRISKFAVESNVREAVKGVRSFNQACIRLGVAATGKNYQYLAEACIRFGIQQPPHRSNRVFVPSSVENNRPFSEIPLDEVRVAAVTARSQAGALFMLLLTPSLKNYQNLRSVCAKHGFKVPPSYAGKGYLGMPNEEFFVAGVKRNTSDMKKKIIRDNLIPHENCFGCRIPAEWNGKPLSFHLDHISGDTSDNRLSNLRFLCPNCHSQTATYCRPKSQLTRVEAEIIEGIPLTA